MNKQEIIRKVENTQMPISADNKKIEKLFFSVGDTVIVHTKIIEENKVRIQKLKGIVIKINKKSGLRQNFIIRRETNGIWNEITFDLYNPIVSKVELVRKGEVNRAYISYLRKRSGKKARISQN